MRKQIKNLIFYGILLLSIPFSAMAIEVFIDGLQYSVDENQEEDMIGGRTSNFWKTYGGKYQTITDKAVNITGDLEFQDEIKPDGATCSVGQILKKTGADNWDCAADASGGAGDIAQLGQIGDVSTSTLATGYTLHYDGSNWNASSTLFVNATTGTVSIGTTTSCQKLCVDGSIRTTDTFYGNTWTSYDGDSMNIKPSGDEDDFLSFKTIANRPTTKIEGGPFYFFESSSSYFTGLSMRKDDTHSGSIIYYKQKDQFGLSSKDPIVFKACEDYDDYVKICSADNIPELSVASSSGFKINAGGTNSLLLNHAGGNVGIGTTNPGNYKLDINGGLNVDGIGTFQADPWTAVYIQNNSGANIGALSTYPSGTFTVKAANNSDLYLVNDDISGIIVKDSSGNVGIGTTSPLSKFSMNSGTNGFRIDSSGIVQQGTWQGTALTDAYVSNTLTVDGYYNAISDFPITAGNIIYGNASGAGTLLASSTVGKVLKIGATGYPEWGDDADSGGATAWDDITNPDADDEIDFGSYQTELNVENFRIGDGGSNYFQILGTGNASSTGNLYAATYGSDASITDAEFLYINTLSSNAQTQISGKEGTLTNSAGLLAALSDETGTGVAVFGTSPTFTTGITVPANSISHTELSEADAFVFTGSVAIPQGAGVVIDSVGEIGIDTTDDQLIVYGASAKVIQTKVKIWSATIASTSPAFIAGSTLAVPVQLDGYTMTEIRCKVDGGTSKIIAVEDASANTTEDITCATSVTSDDGSITNATVTAAEEMYIDFGAVNGAVNTVSISVFGTWTRE